MKKILNALFYIFAALYPVLIFSFLVVFRLPVRLLSIFVIVFAFVFLMNVTSQSKKSRRTLVTAALFFLSGVLCFATNKTLFLKLYSVVVSLSFLFVFASSLFFRLPLCSALLFSRTNLSTALRLEPVLSDIAERSQKSGACFLSSTQRYHLLRQ